MLSKTKGIVLHQFKYSESSVIATIYTELYGRNSFIINRVRGRGASQKANILQPLFILDMDIYYKPNRDIQRVKEFKNSITFSTIPYHISKSSIALFLGEVLYKSIREEESNKDLFTFLYNMIQLLDITETGISNFHLMFLLQLTKNLGFYPETNYSKTNHFFDLQNGTFTSSIPFHPNYLGPKPSEILYQALQLNTHNLTDMDISLKERSHLLEKIIEYYRLHISGFGKVNALQIMQEVFHQI